MSLKVKFLNKQEYVFKDGAIFCDPCYLKFPSDSEDSWDDFCNAYFKSGNGLYEINGAKLLVMDTANGDGCYNVKTALEITGGSTCGVDAGILCVFSLNDLPKLSILKEQTFIDQDCLGQIVKDFSGKVAIKGNDFIGDHELHLITSTKPQMQELINELCNSISNKKLLISFWHNNKGNGKSKVYVQPYLLGINKDGNHELVAFFHPSEEQKINGMSEGIQKYLLSNISELGTSTSRHFKYPRDGYNPDDEHMQRIICKISQ